MATNPIGQETKIIGIKMKKEMADEIENRADSMYLSHSRYCKIILSQWLESGQKLKLEESY